MDKATVRQQFLAKRKALTADEVNRRSQRIAERFFDFLEKSSLRHTSARIHTFLPIKRQNEVDTWPIIHCLWASYTNLRIATSTTNVSTRTLHHYPLCPQTLLIENRWGIPEPAVNHPSLLEPLDIDLVLIPLLAFDQAGQRVGYGGGFYDRFLAECRADCLKIGLSLFDPTGQIEAIEPTDIPLNACITPDQVWLFS